MSVMLQDKRATRGERMTELIGEAADQDATFWGDSVWKEDSEDESFSSGDEEIKGDEFDSDFDESEDSEEEGSVNEEDKKRITNKSAPTNKYKEPPQVKQKRSVAIAELDVNEGNNGISVKQQRPKKSSHHVKLEMDVDFSIERSKRESTKSKSESHIMLVKQQKEKPKITYKKQIKHQFNQKELLTDALDTEMQNEKWLRLQKLAEDEKIASEKPLKATSSHYVRFISKRGQYNTITFSDVDLMPKILVSRKNKGGMQYDENEDDD